MLHSGQANVRSFRVVPDLPEPLQPLLEIAHNLWWTWHPEAQELFVRLDRELWEETHHNPVKLLGRCDQRLLDRYAADQSYLHALDFVHRRFKQHRERRSWFMRQYAELLEAQDADDGRREPMRVAYFSAEFGLAECFQIYSGGLGCLAGDHVKSASELGLPFVGVGLLYRCGYFHQYLNADGYQQETYPDIDFPNQPISRLIDPDTGEQYRVDVELPGRSVTVGVWKCNVGRVPLYLLDTNMPENNRHDRDITKNLYGGDIDTRIQQEIVLGIGGIRALDKIGERPTVFHINEGHAAFISLERISRLREDLGLDFPAALQAAAAGNLFTTHTPVPAGIDRFSPELVKRYFEHMLPRLGCDLDALLSLGRSNPFNKEEFFSMAVLALRCSQFANGVSKLHGVVSREMWAHIWPGLPVEEAPIGSVTNGVHPRTWISPELIELYDRYIGPDWQLDPTDHHLWRRVFDIPDEQLWLFRQHARQLMITWVRARLRKQLLARGASPHDIDHATGALGSDVLTIGFARRFATYKRGTLLMRDQDRLEALLTDPDRPIQLLIAGKSHPADKPGKELIRQLVKLSESGDNFRRIVFLEDYDMDVARRLVQGCDIWLNTPRRGMEASGTSGMKAAMNGCLNCSILDGWWDEAYDPELGFAIGHGETYPDDATADAIESRSLYDLLERQIIPEFYERSAAGIPKAWIARMKRCIATLTPDFSTNRMVADYATNYYVQAHGLSESLRQHDAQGARGLAAQIQRYRERWDKVRVREVLTDVGPSIPVRTPVRVRAAVDLGGLAHHEVMVQLFSGEVTSLGDMVNTAAHNMHYVGERDGSPVFEGEFLPGDSGRRGFTVRLLPQDDRIRGTLIPGLLTWDTSAPTVRVNTMDQALDPQPTTTTPDSAATTTTQPPATNPPQDPPAATAG